MKETIKVNLNGQLFDLDKDAYERLQGYLESLEHKFGKNSQNAKEILEDIEARIAELLNAKISSNQQVVTLSDVEEIISKLGTADEMGEAETGPADDHQYKKQHTKGEFTSTRRRLYRNTDNSVIGGVASGIAAYMGIDAVWVRILFIVFTFFNIVLIPFFHLSGFGLVVYLILWIIVPAAKTRAQKLEMQGKPVNIDNIYDSVRNEYGKVKKGFSNMHRSREYRNVESALNEFFRVMGQVLLAFVKIIGAIIGAALIITLIAVLISFIIGGASLGTLHHWTWPHLWNWQQVSLIGICLLLVIIIPILIIIGKLVRWIFDLPRRNSSASVIGATVWVLAFISLIVLLVNHGSEGFLRKTTKELYPLDMVSSKPLYIDLDTRHSEIDNLEHYQIFRFDFYWNDNQDEIYNEPCLEIKPANDNSCRLEVQREYYNLEVGKVTDDEHDIAGYNWNVNDTVLVLDKFYVCDEDELWRAPFVKLILYIPNGKKINLSSEASNILCNENTSDKDYKNKFAGKKLEMTPTGLEILK